MPEMHSHASTLQSCSVVQPGESVKPVGSVYPYGDHFVCCAPADRPFQITTPENCDGARILEWPGWERENGCVAPASSEKDLTPVCCVLLQKGYVIDVMQTTYADCRQSQSYSRSWVPLSWCSLPRCIDGDPAANYPDGMVVDGEVVPTTGNSRANTDSQISSARAKKCFAQ